MYFDIFFYVREEDRCWMALWVDGKPRKMIFPSITDFVCADFCGNPFKVPANYEEILEANYGNWKVAEPPVERGGTWDWANSPHNYEGRIK